jgi:hypothetical protein
MLGVPLLQLKRQTENRERNIDKMTRKMTFLHTRTQEAKLVKPANTGLVRDKKKTRDESDLLVMVEAAGIEPASKSTLQIVLHT